MENGKLEIYKQLKELKLIKKPIEEYETMLGEEAHKTEFEMWRDCLDPAEKRDFLYVFGD